LATSLAAALSQDGAGAGGPFACQSTAKKRARDAADEVPRDGGELPDKDAALAGLEGGKANMPRPPNFSPLMTYWSIPCEADRT
jgi:hypothetical protein